MKLDLEYFREQLRRDPIAGSELIVARRGVVLNLETQSRNKPRTLVSPEIVAHNQRTIDRIRGEFWELPIDQLQSELGTIDTQSLPELQLVVDRLARAAAARAEFPRLSAAIHKRTRLFTYIRRSVSAMPRDLAGIKELAWRDALQNGYGREIKWAARLIKQEYPTIYAIDPHWIDDLITVRAPSGARWSLLNLKFPVPGWVLAIVFFAIFRLLAALNR